MSPTMEEEWPNSIGFDAWQEQRTPTPLKVIGTIPPYVCGTLYRTAPLGSTLPLPSSAQPYSTLHWFDSFSSLHRFTIHPTSPITVTHTSSSTCDSLLHHIRTTGTVPNTFSFAQSRDPCKSLFGKLQSFFTTSLDLRGDIDDPSKVNVNVTVSVNPPGLPGPGLYTKTDANVMQRVDMETLEPVGVVNQTSLHPGLMGPLTAAHERKCPETGDVYNYNLTLAGPFGHYKLFRVSAATGETEILTTLWDAPGAYIHSFWLTKRWVILCVFSGRFRRGGVDMLWNKNIVESLADFTPGTVKAVWYFVAREKGDSGERMVRRVEGDGFFAFHCVNAWEEDEAGDVVQAEVVKYDSLDVLKKFYLANLRGEEEEARRWVNKGRGELVRFRIDLRDEEDGTVEKLAVLGGGMACELPTMNSKFEGRMHRNTYALVNRGKSTLFDGIGKFDGEGGGRVTVWEEKGCTPGEAVFVGDPEGTGEDDGALLSVVLDGFRRRSFLLCLDARTMIEMGRATLGEGRVVGHGFHGAFVGEEGGVVET